MMSSFEHPMNYLLLAEYPWGPQYSSVLMGLDRINPMRSNSQVNVNQQVQFQDVVHIMGMGTTVGPEIFKLQCQSYNFFPVHSYTQLMGCVHGLSSRFENKDSKCWNLNA